MLPEKQHCTLLMQMSNHSDWERITPSGNLMLTCMQLNFKIACKLFFLILYAMMWTLSIAPARSSLLYQDFRKIAISIVFIFYFFDIVSMGILTAKPETK